MIVNFLTGILGVILFLFIFWKKLKEDYSSNIIFTTAFAILIGSSLGLTISRIFFPTWFFWFAFLGSILGMFLMITKFKFRFYETIEALILSTIPLISLMFFKDSIVNSSLNSFLAFVTSLILIFLSYWFDINYKSFSWYKSGRIGFTGISIAIIFFITRTLVAIFKVSMVSFVGQIEIVTSGLMVLVGIGLLVNLGRQKE